MSRHQPTLTALMTVYAGTAAAELRRSFDCLAAQTRPADELVVVVDGPVPGELEQILEDAATTAGARIIALPENRGSGVASQAGLVEATGDLIARHDSDDISLPHRFATQLQVMAERELDLLGSAVTEFAEDPGHVRGIRSMPLEHEQIVKRSRINNPINNPTVIFRRELALAAGGYADLRYMQDYDLFVRMLAAGARAGNLAEPLVLFSAGTGMHGRRKGRTILELEWRMQRRFVDVGWIGYPTALRNLVMRGTFRLLPGAALARAYRVLFVRERPAAGD